VRSEVRVLLGPPSLKSFCLLARGHSSAGRAPALQAGGRRFDPDWLHQIPRVAVDVVENGCGAAPCAALVELAWLKTRFGFTVHLGSKSLRACAVAGVRFACCAIIVKRRYVRTFDVCVYDTGMCLCLWRRYSCVSNADILALVTQIFLR
jgi:hypothetical protein